MCGYIVLVNQELRQQLGRELTEAVLRFDTSPQSADDCLGFLKSACELQSRCEDWIEGFHETLLRVSALRAAFAETPAVKNAIDFAFDTLSEGDWGGEAKHRHLHVVHLRASHLLHLLHQIDGSRESAGIDFDLASLFERNENGYPRYYVETMKQDALEQHAAAARCRLYRLAALASCSPLDAERWLIARDQRGFISGRWSWGEDRTEHGLLNALLHPLDRISLANLYQDELQRVSTHLGGVYSPLLEGVVQIEVFDINHLNRVPGLLDECVSLQEQWISIAEGRARDRAFNRDDFVEVLSRDGAFLIAVREHTHPDSPRLAGYMVGMFEPNAFFPETLARINELQGSGELSCDRVSWLFLVVRDPEALPGVDLYGMLTEAARDIAHEYQTSLMMGKVEEANPARAPHARVGHRESSYRLLVGGCHPYILIGQDVGPVRPPSGGPS